MGSDTVINGHSGQVGIWVETSNSYLNGDIDLFLWPPSNYEYCNFGWAKATGDFIGDALCDLAISAPWYFEGQPSLTNGKVYIYSGNTLLQDSAVGVEDEVIPAVQSEGWNLNIYPNPVQHGRLGISIIKSENSLPSPDNFCIYNMKGQLVMKSELRDTDWQKGVVELIVPDLPNGVYLVRLPTNKARALLRK